MSWYGLGRTDAFVCEPADGTAARHAVSLMNELFEAARKPANYQPIISSINKAWSEWDRALVFYTWCDARQIGQRAQQVSMQIATEYGLVSEDNPQLERSTFSLLGATKWGLIAAGAAALAGFAWWVGDRAGVQKTIFDRRGRSSWRS